MSRLTNKLVVSVGLLSGLFAVFLFSPPANAITGADWNAGTIASDGVFFDSSSMSIADIQNFLNNKMPNCDTNGTQPYAGTTRAAYGASRGNPAPFTCVRDYVENPNTHQNNANGGAVSGGWGSAQIIKHAADTYNVSPKVLLVLLEKEQGLITDDWPWLIQYRSATGYGCPDTAPCDAEYYGFYNQVMNAASQFRRYATNPGSYRYKAYQTNYIQYNPNAGCGGTNVYVTNQATAGLYNYTPYQPNASALANLYGSGDGCGAYGNRNFWRMFNDWFGDPRAAPVTLTDSPGSVSWGSGRLDVFARGSDGGLWQKWYDVNVAGGWQPWVKFNGSSIHSAPTVSTMGPGRLDVFTKGAGGDLMHYWFGSGAWQNWESLGQPTPSVYLISSPAAVSWANGRIDIFARGSDGGLWQKWYDVNHGGWNAWARVGSNITSAPSVSSWKSERLDLFARGASGELLHYWFQKPQGWGSESLGGNIASNPASASWSEGRLDVFVQGSDGYMWQRWYDSNVAGGFQPWHRFGFGLSSNPSVSSWGPGRLDMFTKGTASDLQHYWFTNLSWSSHWESLNRPL